MKPHILAEFKPDRVGWWITIYGVAADGVRIKLKEVESYRRYNTLAQVKSMVRKQFNVSKIVMKRK